MADLIFYTNPQSRGRTVRWMLEEVGARYETEIIPYDQMKSERYLAVNPMGKVPAIKHGNHVVTEGAAICTYLADAFPELGSARATMRKRITIAGSSTQLARSRRQSRTRRWAGSRRPSANGCSVTAISTGSSLSSTTSYPRAIMFAATASRPPTSISARRSCSR